MVNNTNKKQATTSALIKGATLTVASNGNKPLTYANIWAFVNGNCGGNLHNCIVQPLGNVQLNNAVPVPFGYNGGNGRVASASGGVRATIQNWHLNGVKGVRTLHAILTASKPLGHSSKSPICTLALLNGGYTPNAKTFGTSYIQLVAQASTSKA